MRKFNLNNFKKSEEIIPFKYDFVEIRHPEGENFVFAIVQENNIWSVVFLGVGTLSLIGIIILLCIKPKEETDND